MKPHTRRIIIFIGLKLKEIGIVLAWIVGIGGALFGMFMFNHRILKLETDMSIWCVFGELIGMCIILLLVCVIVFIFIPTLKDWIKSNWIEAGQIEQHTRKKK